MPRLALPLIAALALAAALALGLAACPKDAARAPDAGARVEGGVANVDATAQYTCPMHPDVVSSVPGKCPKCGMALVSTAPQAPIEVTVTTTPARPQAGTPTKVAFEMKSEGKRLTAFDVVHDKKLHLLMVTPDLAWFAHEHPEPQPDGTFAFDYTFPAGGTYRLFTDFKATERAGVVLSTDIVVEGAPGAPQALAATDLTKPRAVDGLEVRLTSPPPVTNVEKQLTFVITRDGKPVLELEPYLGAMGHLVVIHEDGKTFLHAHPEDHGHAKDPKEVAAHEHAPDTPEHAHSSTPGLVSFATVFPKPGKYKAWAQFQVKGKVTTADFVLDVPAGAPAAAPPGGGASHGHAH